MKIVNNFNMVNIATNLKLNIKCTTYGLLMTIIADQMSFLENSL